MLKNLKLSQQLSASFGIMIVLMIGLSTLAYTGLTGGYTNFVEYRNLARSSNAASGLEADLLTTRINVLNYLNQHNKQQAELFDKQIDALKVYLSNAKEIARSEENMQLLEQSHSVLLQYEAAFRQIVALFGRRDTIVKSTLDRIGPTMRENITQLAQQSASDKSLAGLEKAEAMQEKLLLGRLFVTKYLVDNRIQDFENSMSEFQQLNSLIAQTRQILSNDTGKQLLQDTAQLSEQYIQGIKEVRDIIEERNELINQAFNPSGQQIAGFLKQIKLDIKSEQDALGPLAQAQSEQTISNIVIVAIFMLIIGCFFSWYITRLIKAPIGGEPQEIADVASRIAEGDLTIEFNKSESATGIYLAMQDMGDRLKAIIAEIQSSTGALSSSSETLSAITAQSKQGADNQMEQLSLSAVSMNEMAATIAEITQSAQLAADAATDADALSTSGGEVVIETQQAMKDLVKKINNVSKTIEHLEKETESVGSILDVIRGIAEQTNLLALNAAIEAARAGEQGRGFAVVADEVRSLASRTQQSTDEIQEMISKLQNEAKRSVTMMRENVQDAKDTANKSAKTEELLTSISSAISTIKDMNLQIASASEEQNTVTQQISQSVTEINETAQETTIGAEQASTEALSLLTLARTLNKSVSSFRL
ncbi:methyl-accepting chemotaxis protein [Pseudoalteromonas piscicida]|uniref:Chemotaxis protein n=1 Tax=Pseudoalteromonas piscicida TaxID=43662 RepID=A0A2A5JN02_PSEO7|nr:methyl-accepting chemotaxis protein [Pseudoalteromonas piscicida]PCK30844.1 chemotaxis protein [Pseudoalteromonas piscicida]